MGSLCRIRRSSCSFRALEVYHALNNCEQALVLYLQCIDGAQVDDSHSEVRQALVVLSTDYFAKHRNYSAAKFHEEHRAKLKIALENVALRIVAVKSGAPRAPIHQTSRPILYIFACWIRACILFCFPQWSGDTPRDNCSQIHSFKTWSYWNNSPISRAASH